MSVACLFGLIQAGLPTHARTLTSADCLSPKEANNPLDNATAIPDYIIGFTAVYAGRSSMTSACGSRRESNSCLVPNPSVPDKSLGSRLGFVFLQITRSKRKNHHP